MVYILRKVGKLVSRGIVAGILILILIIIVPVVMVNIPGHWVDESKAVDALERHGFSDIKIIKKDWFMVGFLGCGREDVVKFTAHAKNPLGKEVEVYVCVGWPFKGATVRS